MTLRPIPGAPPGAPNPDFPTDGNKSFTEQPAPTAPIPPPSTAKQHWTRRTDQIGSFRLAPRRGYGGEVLYVRLFADGSLVVFDVELPRAAADRFIGVWQSGRGEFEYVASMTVTLTARWMAYNDGKRGFVVHEYDRMRARSDLMAGTCGALEREAIKTLKELLMARGLSSICSTPF